MAKYIKQRALLYAALRQYLASQNVLEVDVPVIGATRVSDPHLQSLTVNLSGRECYLQTSPEFFMKRMLAADSGAIYYLGKAFREDESGRMHNPEFTMLEWYRPGYDDHHLMGDVVALIRSVEPGIQVNKVAYADIFESEVGVNPHNAPIERLKEIAHNKFNIQWDDDNKSTWLDVLFTHMVEPSMSDGLTVVFDYPVCQCALAKIASNRDGLEVARRFEVFWNGVELANGYWELTDAEVQRKRFERDNQLRRKIGLPEVVVDEKFLEALEKGLPECAGVALGVDRLLMCMLGETDIREVIAFPFGEL